MHLKTITPFIIFFLLLGLLGSELLYSQPRELPSVRVGEDVPAFSLPNIFPSQPNFQSSDLKENILLLTVWSTWCEACNIEHPMMMKIKNEYHVPLFGINYKDNPQNVAEWLSKNGNPYILSGNDSNGDTAIDLGVYGTPETFVIKKGKIIYRHIGILDQQSWDEKLYPLIKKNENNP